MRRGVEKLNTAESVGGDGGEGTRWQVGSVKDLPLTMDWKRAGL